MMLLLVSCFITVRCASLTPKPFWLKEGSYAYYYFSSTMLHFLNNTFIWYSNGTYGWKCMGIAGETAALEMFFNITGRRQYPNETTATPYSFSANYMVKINVETRETTCGDEYLGFLHYWIPAAIENLPYMDPDRLPEYVPKNIQWKVIENFTSFGDVMAYGLVANVTPTIKTPYKDFKGDELRAIFGEFNSTEGFTYMYEKDSGLWVASIGRDNFWYKVLEFDGTGNLLLSDTNIHSLPDQPSLLTILLPYIVAIVIIIAATATIYFVKIRRKKTDTTKGAQTQT
jgi:hypothetical protein